MLHINLTWTFSIFWRNWMVLGHAKLAWQRERERESFESHITPIPHVYSSWTGDYLQISLTGAAFIKSEPNSPFLLLFLCNQGGHYPWSTFKADFDEIAMFKIFLKIRLNTDVQWYTTVYSIVFQKFSWQCMHFWVIGLKAPVISCIPNTYSSIFGVSLTTEQNLKSSRNFSWPESYGEQQD